MSTAAEQTPRASTGRPNKGEERREQILEGLFEAMARSGTRGTSISEIAASAGIARGALHYYFESKEEIRLRLMERLGDRYLDGLAAYLDRHEASAQEDGGRAMVEALVRYHFAPEDDSLARMLSVWIDFWGHAPTDPSLRDVVLDVQERARRQCWRVIAASRPELAALDDDDARLKSAALLALIEGAILQWRIAQGARRPLKRRALLAQIAQTAFQLCQTIDAPLIPAPPSTSVGGRTQGDA